MNFFCSRFRFLNFTMMVQQVSFSEIIVSIYYKIKDIPEIAQFDYQSFKKSVNDMIYYTIRTINYYKNYFLAVMWLSLFVISLQISNTISYINYLVFRKFSANDVLQSVWLSSHIFTIFATWGYYYEVNSYNLIIISSITTYILLTIKYCQDLYYQCQVQESPKRNKPIPTKSNPSNSTPVPISTNIPMTSTSRFALETASFQGYTPRRYTIPTSLPMSSSSSNSGAKSDYSDMSEETIMPQIEKPLPAFMVSSPFTSILKLENTHVLGMLGLLLATPSHWSKLISINIFSYLNIIGFLLYDAFPNNNVMVLPLFQFLELKILKLTVVIDLLMTWRYYYEYYYKDQFFYPVIIYSILTCMRFENSMVFQQVIYHLVQFQLTLFNKFPSIVRWLNACRVFLFLNDQIFYNS